MLVKSKFSDTKGTKNKIYKNKKLRIKFTKIMSQQNAV